MFSPKDIIYEDNHLLVVNKRAGDLVQPDPAGNSALENEVKDWIKLRDSKPGAVFLGVAHRLDRPVSGVVMFAKTSKSLVRLNQMFKDRSITKLYWAIVEQLPDKMQDTLTHHIVHDTRKHLSRAYNAPIHNSKEARLNYRVLASGDRYHLLEIKLITGRHHQIRAQLSKIGCSIRGDLKYHASRSNPGGGISLHARSIEFTHPVSKEQMKIVAPTPEGDNLWAFFENTVPGITMTT